MEILSENRRILSYIGLGADDIIHLFGRSIPRRIVAFIFGCMLLFGVLCAGLLIVNLYANGMAVLLLPITVMLTCVSQMLIYISLVAKRKQIYNLMDYLAYVVGKRMALLQTIIVGFD